MLPSGNNSWDTQEIIPQSPVHRSDKDVPSPADVEGGFTEMVAAPNDTTSETTSTAMRAAKFDIDHYRHQNLQFRVNQINNLEIPLRNIRDDHVLSLASTFRAYGLENAIETLSVTNKASENRSKACEGFSLSTLAFSTKLRPWFC